MAKKAKPKKATVAQRLDRLEKIARCLKLGHQWRLEGMGPVYGNKGRERHKFGLSRKCIHCGEEQGRHMKLHGSGIRRICEYLDWQP